MGPPSCRRPRSKRRARQSSDRLQQARKGKRGSFLQTRKGRRIRVKCLGNGRDIFGLASGASPLDGLCRYSVGQIQRLDFCDHAALGLTEISCEFGGKLTIERTVLLCGVLQCRNLLFSVRHNALLSVFGRGPSPNR